MLGHRFEVQCERHEESTTPAARARRSSEPGVSGSATETLATRREGKPGLGLAGWGSRV
jgi:hypothetical protein